MQTQTRVLLLSVALNLVLLGVSAYAFLGLPSGPSSSAARPAPLVTESKTPPVDIPVGELSAELARLRGLGLTVEETMPIILDRVRRNVAGTVPAVEDRYWQSDWQGVSREGAAARARQTDAIRTALLAVYGPTAESAAPLHDLFRPLDATLPFLSPAEQRAIVQFRLARSAHASAGPPSMSAPMAMPAAMPPAPPGMPAGSRGPLPGSHAEFMASLPTELSSEAAFEVALRESPLAARLRSARADLTEPEFRALFRAMADAERDRVPLSLDAVASQVPREKALKVVSQGDPAWLGLQAAATRLSLSEPQISAIYDAVRQANASLAAFANAGSNAAPDRATRIAAIMQERQHRIEQVVGAEQATAVLNVLNDSYRAFALQAPRMGAPNTR